MVEISEIDSGKSLRAWLEALPQGTAAEQAEARRIAVSIAARAAARVLPLYWQWSLGDTARRGDLTALPILRRLLISSVAATMPTEDIRDAAFAATAAAAAAATAIADAAAYAADAAFAATATADAAADAAFAADAAAATAADAAATAAAWDAVQQDCRVLLAGDDAFLHPLWPTEPPFAPAWSGILNAVDEDPRDWGFWVTWYTRMLDPKGQAPNWKMLEEVALIKPKIWDGPVDAALNEINGICARYRDRSDDLSDLVDQEMKRQPSAAKAVIEKARQSIGDNRKTLPPTIDGLQELMLLEIKRWQESNELNATMPDLCRQQIQTYLVMYEALERMRKLVPDEGLPSIAETEKIVGLARLYRDKFAGLPRAKADDVVQAVWERGGNAVDLGLVFGTTALLTTLQVPPQTAVMIGSLAFGRKYAGDIIKGAKDYLKGSGD